MTATITKPLPPPQPRRRRAPLRRPRRPAVRVVLLILVLLSAEGAARLAATALPDALRHYDHTAERRVQQMEDVGGADVVFAGSSMAWQAFDPTTFTTADPRGRSSFNAGLNGAVPTVTGPWLVDEVVPRLSPDTIVWGLSTLDLAPGYGDVQLTAYESSAAGRPGLLGFVERSAADLSILVRERAVLRRPDGATTAGLVEGRERAAEQTGPAGTRRVPGEGRDAEQQAIQRARLAGFSIDATDLEAVVATSRALQTRGIDVVFTELPLPPTTIALHPGGADDVALARAAIAGVARTLGAPFVPAGRGWTDADFADLTHLSPQGARRYSRAVATTLADVTRRTDPTPTADFRAYVDGGGVDALEDVLRLGVVEQIGCAGRALPDDLLAAASPRNGIADARLAATLQDLLDRVTFLVDTCQAENAWRMAMLSVIAAEGEVILELRELLGAEDLPAVIDLPDAASRSSEELAVAGLHGLERLVWLLRGAGNPRLFRHDVWWSFAQRGNTHRILDAARSADEPPVVVLGTSQSRTGIDADRLSQLLGEEVVNLGIDGATIDATQVVIEEILLPHVTPERAVIVVAGLDFLTPLPDRCPDDRLRGITDSLRVAERAFASVPWLDAAASLRLAADPGESLPIGLRSPLVGAFEPAPDVDFPDLDDADIPRLSEPYVIAYRRNTPCPGRFAALEASIRSLRQSGVAVTVLTHPVRDLLLDAAPDGAVRDMEVQIRETAIAAGADVVSATTLLSDNDMVDAVHVSEAGGEALTQHLADAMNRVDAR